jgi:hypothetical protein
MALGADDLPAFSYMESSPNALRFARCLDVNCAPYTVVTAEIDDHLVANRGTAIALRPNGLPIIAYVRKLTVAGGAEALYVAECLDLYCTAVDRFPVDSTSVVGSVDNPRMTIGADGGAVIVARYGGSMPVDRRTILAKCSAQSCRGPGDRIFSDGYD